MDCKPVLPGSYVPKATADKRTALYQNSKWLILSTYVNGLHTGAQEEISWTFGVAMFVKFLTRLANIPGVDGVRIYFASYDPKVTDARKHMPAGNDDRLALVFAPTSFGGGTGVKIYHNDISYFTFNDDNPLPVIHPLPTSFARRWVTSFRGDKLTLLRNDGKKVRGLFDETTSVWYKIGHITDWLNVIACATPLGLPAIENVTLFTAVYEMEHLDYSYCLGLIITMYDGSKNAVHLEDYEAYQQFFTKGAGDSYDTGSPCPPDPNACLGAGFP